jgi:hypothetical protein
MLKIAKFMKNEKADMDMLGSIAIGLLGLVIIFSLVMTIGPKIDETRPTDLAADSDWNATYNTDLVEPATLWSDNATFISLSAMVIIISVLMFYVFRMRGQGGAGGM